MENIRINKDQSVYVIPCGNGFTCLGFQNAFDKTKTISEHYGLKRLQPNDALKGTEQGYSQYATAIEYARAEHARTGSKCTVELSPQLIGLEGRRVEVVDVYGEKRRFKVGKSTGWIPCHLELARANSIGGPCADKTYKSVTVIK